MKSFATSLLSSDEIYTSSVRINEIISTSITSDPFLTKVLPLLKVPLDDLLLAIGRTSNSAHVKLLASKDGVRDLRYIALRDFCKAIASDADANLASAAVLLENVFKELGWSMHLEGYAVESTLLQALIAKFEKAPFSAALTTIGAAAKFTGLKAAQADFETTFGTKVDAKAKEEYPKIRNSRTSITRYLGAMLSYVDIMAEMESGAFKTASDKIDLVITEFEAMAHNRITRKENDKKNKPGETHS